ncbi:MAG: hypothetical protein GXP55_19540 [Deltaproteobacteria bacterium]|nr:hypothetical protein [Deltaproteobacteria bacterium]
MLQSQVHFVHSLAFTLPMLLLSVVTGACRAPAIADAGIIDDSAAPADARSRPDGAVRDSAVVDGAVRDSASLDGDGSCTLPPRPFSNIELKFDRNPDWQTQGRDMVGPLPCGFDYGYTDEEWHPSDVLDSLPSIFIGGRSPDQVFGGTGKSLVATYESLSTLNGLNSNGSWPSDGFLTIDVIPTREIYVRFRMRFQDGFYTGGGGAIKLFRILSYDGSGSRSKFGGGGNTSPLYFFDWASSDEFGVRQKHGFRCDDQAANYYCENPAIGDAPRSVFRGDMSGNFTSNVESLSARIPDLVNGGFLPYSGSVTHDQVYGDVWHKLEFHLVQNGSPGALDGEFQFWLDGQLLVDMRQIAWIGTGGDMNALWNGVAFGGNGKYSFNSNPADSVTLHERWVAFDDVVIRDTLPSVR